MPPSRHSSSSHSSSFSGSRSSGGSFRSPSSHSSSSSRSYSPRPSSPAPSSRPSSFSGGGSSHSGRPSPNKPKNNMKPPVPFNPPAKPAPFHHAPPPRRTPRPRFNQPMGFVVSERLRPVYYYGNTHDYVYYPADWIDTQSGTSYRKGYYDENGEYYESVAIQEDDKSKNIVCHCSYCGTDTVLPPDETFNLVCPNCGAPMEIKSKASESLKETEDSLYVSAYSQSGSSMKTEQKSSSAKILGKAAKTLLVIVLCLFLALVAAEANQVWLRSKNGDSFFQQTNVGGAYGQKIYLKSLGNGAYSKEGKYEDSWDKLLVWDAEADSYYDPESNCWLWYNTDVSPSVWQYWYEGISSDFEDCGWMEHDEDGWWVEKSEGDWIQLPGKYNTEKLWYIA